MTTEALMVNRESRRIDSPSGREDSHAVPVSGRGNLLEEIPFESRLMYTEIILDYYRNPRCFGTLENPHFSARDTNPSCGDVIQFQGNVDRDDIIKELCFSGKGCAISQAASSMIAETMIGKHLDEVAQLTKQAVLEMMGIPISAMRLKCALLGMKVLKMAAYQHLGKDMEEEDLP